MELSYVYLHIDPESGEILYVGIGINERAWVCSMRGSSRKPEHAKRLQSLFAKGYTMGDIVKIEATLLSRDQAKELETRLVNEYRPIYNVFKNRSVFKNTKFSLEQANKAKELHSQGTPYYMLPTYFNLKGSNMSVLGKRMVEAAQ
jgi:hypothetical protein